MTEQEAFRAYLEAIERIVGHDASAAEARRACPDEYGAWIEAFNREYDANLLKADSL